MILIPLHLLMLITLGQGQARDVRQPSIAAATASISGVVLDAERKPLRRARVTATGDNKVIRASITDDRGVFSVTALPAGRYSLAAVRGGYARATFGATRPNRPGTTLAVADGQQIADIALTLQRGGVITGRVLDEQGQPMPGVNLTVYMTRTTTSGERTLTGTGFTGQSPKTDDRGVYRIYGLAPGEYVVGTSASPTAPARIPTDAEIRAAFDAAATSRPRPAEPLTRAPASRQMNYSQAYFPDASDPGAATLIPVAAGEERTADLHLRLRPTAAIEATVLGPDGPVPARTGLVLRTILSGASFVTPRAGGVFAFENLSPGEYTLISQYTLPSGVMLTASVDVSTDDRAVTPVTMRLEPGAPMSGHVVFRGRSQPPDPTSAAIQFTHTDHALQFNRISPPKVASDGTFTVEGLMPGKYRASATVRAPAGGMPWTLASITAGGVDVTDSGIDVSQGVARDIVVTFTDEATELSGVVQNTDGHPAPDYFVAVFAADEKLWESSRRIRMARPDVNGRYVFTGLAPGTYRLAVTTDLAAADLTDVSFIRALVPASLDVTLGVNEKKTLDVRVK
jgi:protocatechuate 3,4-dioxygenase beta subunit